MKQSEVIDHLAKMCWQAVGDHAERYQYGSPGAALKLWRFMRPEEAGKLSSAQHHAASRLLTWAQGALRQNADIEPVAKTELTSAIAIATQTLQTDMPTRGRRATRRRKRVDESVATRHPPS